MRRNAHSTGAERQPLKLGSKAVRAAAAGMLAVSLTPAVALADDAAAQDPTSAVEESADVASPETTEAASTDATEEAATQDAVTESDEENAIATLSEEGDSSAGDVQTRAAVASANELADGVNVMKTGATDQTFNIGDGQALMIANQDAETPIVFEGCTFNLAGGTVKISGNQEGVSYNNGETVTKLFVSGNVQFNNCTFVTEDGATKTTGAGYDAAIYFFSGDINLTGCTLSAEGYNGQFLGLYGSTGAVTFDGCDISTVGNKNGWSYAMYGGSVLKLINGSSMTATGSTTDSGNINAFYSGDNRTGYDAIYVDDSTIDFSDNHAGGFAINNVNIHVSNGSTITVNDNLGNACNSGYWIVDDSTIQMNGNKGGHGLSCIGFEMTNSTLDVEHNGYAGVYLQSRDSSLTNCTVDIACNGENMLSYSALDITLNTHALSVSGNQTTSSTYPGAAWLGGVGRTGAVSTTDGAAIVAHDLSDHSVDNLKSNCSPVLTGANVVLNDEDSEHTLFLNPFMKSDYARGNAESSASDNDADLFADDNVTDRTDIIGAENAKIGTLTDADLAHHKYDWTNGEVTDQATTDAYGVERYACTLACDDYANRTDEHANSFDCDGTYVYAPLVGIEYKANTGSDEEDAAVTGMPATETAVEYGATSSDGLSSTPVRPSNSSDYNWEFTGWYLDPDCTEPVENLGGLTDNWTTLYAGWKQVPVETEEPTTPGTPATPTNPETPGTPSDNTGTADGTSADKTFAKTNDATPVAAVGLGALASAAAVAFAVRKTGFGRQ